MRIKDATRFLKEAIKNGVPTYFQGPPGIGKSSIVWQAASAVFNGETTDSTVGGRPDVQWYREFRGSVHDPVDLSGVPSVEKGVTQWNPPAWVPTKGKGVLCVEELAQCAPAMQAGLMELLLDRRVGGRKIGEGWAVVATGNRAEDRAGAMKLLTTNASRLVIIDLEPSVEDLCAWGAESGRLSPIIRAFLNYKPACMWSFDPSRQRNTDPRGWERASHVLTFCPEDLKQQVLSGIVNDGPAAEFITFELLYKNLPDLDKVIAAPATSTVPSEPSVLFALATALAEKTKGAKKDRLASIMKYISRMPTEFGVLAVRDHASLAKAEARATGGNANEIPPMLKTPEGVEWVREHRDVFVQD